MTVELYGAVPQWQPLLSIGDIEADRSWLRCPSGVIPVRSVTWSVQDMSRTDRTIPTWAIVCTVVFTILLCLFGLLFLLAKEERTTGWVQVTATAPGFVHTTQVPVSSTYAVADVMARVNYARSLTAAAV